MIVWLFHTDKIFSVGSKRQNNVHQLTHCTFEGINFLREMIKMLKSKERSYHRANTALVFCSGSKDGPGWHASWGSAVVSPGFASLMSIHTVAACFRNKQIISVKKHNSPEFRFLSGLVGHVNVMKTPCREKDVSLGRFSDKRPLSPAWNAGSQPDQWCDGIYFSSWWVPWRWLSRENPNNPLLITSAQWGFHRLSHYSSTEIHKSHIYCTRQNICRF